MLLSFVEAYSAGSNLVSFIKCIGDAGHAVRTGKRYFTI